MTKIYSVIVLVRVCRVMKTGEVNKAEMNLLGARAETAGCRAAEATEVGIIVRGMMIKTSSLKCNK